MFFSAGGLSRIHCDMFSLQIKSLLLQAVATATNFKDLNEQFFIKIHVKSSIKTFKSIRVCFTVITFRYFRRFPEKSLTFKQSKQFQRKEKRKSDKWHIFILLYTMKLNM